MKKTQASRTAEHMALFRALESARAPRRRILYDPLASAFLSQPFRWIARLSHLAGFGGAVRWYIDRRWPGSRTSGIARTRLIDDHLTTALRDGISQVAILGAGYDTRAYRIPGIERARVFEVDHPNTSAIKRERIRNLQGGLPAHVGYIAMDFNCESLRDALKRAGFDLNRRTFVIWEGVTNYLAENAVNAMLNFIGSVAPGSRLVFTYVHRDILLDPGKFEGGLRLQRMLARLEESWTFGLDPSQVPTLLQTNGLSFIADIGSVDYRAKYLGANGRHLKGYEFYRVVVAEINRSPMAASDPASGDEKVLHA
jgi:methyltransferase (TIGR00027 family)